MIYRLLLALDAPGFRVFRYITFRAALAAVMALLVSVVIGPWLIRKLREFQIGQSIREEGPSTHQAKKGTPTMGGLLMLMAILVATIFWADLRNPLVLVATGSTMAFGAIGFLDDWQKLARKQNRGLSARGKFGLQLVAAAGVGATLVMLAGRGHYDLRLSIPFFKNVAPDIGLLYVPFAMLVIVGAANAVNLTDGLDGLATGSMATCVSTFAVIAYVVGHAKASEYLGVPFVQLAGELSVFCAAVFGACLGFLWFNCPPAQIFMGDTGSMGLGGAIGTVATCVKQEFLLVIVGGLFVVEASSVILQVASFKLTGTRLFKMAPLHHHFEAHRRDVPSRLRGHDWAESQVVIRFWILAILFALLGLSTLKLR
jgi:phospho-N-acetylmuramoyl-pentapeptide-transferase